MARGLYRRYGKRALDIVLSAAGLVVLSPVFLVLYAVSLAKIGFPVYFRQERPGIGARIFGMVKFRSMTNQRGPDGDLLPDDKRLVPYGRMLRSTSLDELPELWNVLKGDMSLVGPRPLLVRYLPLYSAEQSRRHEVRPGITGWAQVNGRNAIGWEEKFRLDVWYVDNHTFALDMKILFMTVAKVFKRSGISAQGEATMPEFKGSQES